MTAPTVSCANRSTFVNLLKRWRVSEFTGWRSTNRRLGEGKMVEPINILVIEDRNADFLMVERNLKQNGLTARCSRVDTLEGLKEALDMETWDLVLSDYNVPKLNFLESLNLLRAALPDLPVID